MEPNNINETPKEMEIKTGPGGLAGIVIIVAIILLAGIYMFMNRTEEDILNEEIPNETEELTDENVEEDVASLDVELNSIDGDLTEMEAEIDSY